MKNFDLLDESLLYLITDGATTADNFTERKSKILKLIKLAVQAKIALIQIREKRLPDRLTFQLVEKAAALTRNTTTKLLVSDRADIALAARADGVHLTSVSLSAEIVRRSFPSNFIIGVSTHTIEKAKTAQKQGADFVTFSPTYPSPGKGDGHGIEKLREVCERLKPFPVIALGGIDETNFTEVIKAGAKGFAAIRFLNAETNLLKLTDDLNR